jgi:HAD superfamily hydrolase (TIGR01509 family)
MIRGIILDFDGLILDTETPIFQSWREIFERYGCEFTLEAWAESIGRSPDSYDRCDLLEECVGHSVDRDAIHQAQRRREAALISEQPVLPGVLETIRATKRLELKLGIASSSSRDWVLGHLARFGLDCQFDSIRCADDVEHAKPEPDLYLAVLSALALEADEAVALEDSPNGVMAAKRAGLFCIAVPNALTVQLPLDQADWKLRSLAEIPLADLLRTVERKRKACNKEV